MNAMTAIASRKEKGFTLIELVMVIVILGILAAFALPRFADLGGEARAASLQGANGAVRSAAAIARSAWLADGSQPDTVTLDGLAVAMSDAGFPTAAAGGIGLAAQLSSEFELTPGTDEQTDTATIAVADSPNTCQFTYSPTTGVTVLDGDNDC